jgi:hypothetical protein
MTSSPLPSAVIRFPSSFSSLIDSLIEDLHQLRSHGTNSSEQPDLPTARVLKQALCARICTHAAQLEIICGHLDHNPEPAEIRSSSSFLCEEVTVQEVISHFHQSGLVTPFPSAVDLIYIDSHYHSSFSLSPDLFRDVILYGITASLTNRTLRNSLLLFDTPSITRIISHFQTQASA